MTDEILLYRLSQAEAEITALKKDLKEFKEEEQERERKRLLWGISSLGAVIFTLGGVIWSYRAVIFK